MIATSFMKLSDGFTGPAPAVVTAVGYLVAFYFLWLTLRSVPTGIAYAVWSGVGIVLITVVAWIFQRQRLDLPGLAGIALIVAGVIVVNVFSKTAH